MVQTCTHESYIVGIICALAVEKAAVEAMLDEEHSRLAAMAADDNSYSPGRTGEHHVVVACLPAGVTGKASTVTVGETGYAVSRSRRISWWASVVVV
ncbi:hypothetical protein LTS16_025906 [Friedmanniomyces endolithicus]|nr:hypothetical protein LTS16_025906 [Friedmanniomyces endolithicus]